MKTKRLTALLMTLIMLVTVNASIVSATETEVNANLFPAGATELNANWPAVGTGNTMETVIFEGSSISSITANHAVSLAADATVFARRDMTGGYSMECMRNGEFPLEYGKKYKFSTWVKMSSAKLSDLKIKWTFFWDDKAAVESYPDSVMALAGTTDWQEISTTFRVGAANLEGAAGSPVEFDFELLTPSGMTLATGETFSITFHDFSLVELAEEEEVQVSYSNLIIDEFTEGTTGYGQGSNAATAAVTQIEDSFDNSGRNSVLFTHTGDTDNAIGMCHLPSTFTMPTTLSVNKIPLEHGKNYYVSMWVKTNEPTKISSLYPFVRMYHDKSNVDSDGYLYWLFNTNTMPLKNTTDWQYVSTSFTMNDNVLKQVADAGGKLSHFYFNFLSSASFTASESAPVTIAMDRLSLREVPPAGELTVSLESAAPDANSGLADSNEEVVFEFDNPINRYGITEANVFVNGVAQSSSSVDLTVEERKVTIAPATSWKNSTAYTISLSGVTDAWGRAVSGEAQVSFTVKDFLDTTATFYKVAEDTTETPVQQLSSGNIKASCQVTSNSLENQDVIMLLALCQNQTIKKVVASTAQTLSPGGSHTFDASIDVPSGSGYYLKVFLWDSLTSHIGLADIIELR